MEPWDFFHWPPVDKAHAFVGAGDGPMRCLILMVGAHVGTPDGARYPVSELAARYGASVERS